jgi:hypothetical protein
VEWVNPLDQFSLSFLNPDHQVHVFSHQLPKEQEAILKEQTHGYSATSFYLDKSLKGTWRILGTSHMPTDKPISLKITKYEDWGSQHQTAQVYYYELQPNDPTLNLMSFTVN